MTNIERVSGITPRAFLEEYLALNKPVVVTDGTQGWKALSRWTPEYFLAKFGDSTLPISGDFFSPQQKLTLSSFFQLLKRFEALAPEDFDIQATVPYLRLPCPETSDEDDRRLVFEQLREDWTLPYFLPTSLYLSPLALWGRSPNIRPYPEQGLLISARGGCTGLHVDRTNDSALICQISGLKAAYLFAPTEASFARVDDDFRARETGKLPPKTGVATALLAGRLPEYKELTPYQAELRAGDVLYVPKRWPHEVFTLETSISLTYNFLHLLDFDSEYARYRIRNLITGFRERTRRHSSTHPSVTSKLPA